MLFRTTTNVYLLNLAVVDMATVVLYLPFEVYDLWHQYPWMFGHVGCYLKTVVQETITYASILTVVSFSVERYHSFLVAKATSVSTPMTITLINYSQLTYQSNLVSHISHISWISHITHISHIYPISYSSHISKATISPSNLLYTFWVTNSFDPKVCKVGSRPK